MPGVSWISEDHFSPVIKMKLGDPRSLSSSWRQQ